MSAVTPETLPADAVEKVARALFEQAERRTIEANAELSADPSMWLTWETSNELMREPYREQARAAITALEAARSPTPHVDQWDALVDFQSPDRTFLQISKTDFLARSPTSPTDGDARDCPVCGGSGFSGQGSGYGDVCAECGGQRQLPIAPELASRTIPTSPREGDATPADFEAITGLIEHAHQFSPPSCYVASHLFEPLNRIIATAQSAISKPVTEANGMLEALAIAVAGLGRVNVRCFDQDTSPLKPIGDIARETLTAVCSTLGDEAYDKIASEALVAPSLSERGKR